MQWELRPQKGLNGGDRWQQQQARKSRPCSLCSWKCTVLKWKRSFLPWPRRPGQEGVWIGQWHTEQKEAWRKHIFEVPTWRQVRGLTGAVLCETRDLGIKWPQWRTLILEGQVQVDMTYVCPKDVKTKENTSMKSGRKEGIWLEPILALLRR